MNINMKKYFVIGNPIDHSLSPKLQNFWLKEKNINANYDKIKLEDKEIESFINDIRQKKVAGCNVTVPFKKNVIPFLDKLSLEAQQTQSVNTIAYDSGVIIGHNTDVFGFHKAIENLNFTIKNKKVLILGAGGVVPSIIYALKKMDVSEISISNRTKEKADKIKMQFKHVKVIEWGNLIEFDMIINATSLGLNHESINLDFSNIGKNKLFYDVIYNPTETNFLRQGKKLGNITENGKLMFIYQALEAFYIWHGFRPKIDDKLIELVSND